MVVDLFLSFYCYLFKSFTAIQQKVVLVVQELPTLYNIITKGFTLEWFNFSLLHIQTLHFDYLSDIYFLLAALLCWVLTDTACGVRMRNRVEKGLIEMICAFKLLWLYIPKTQICFSGLKRVGLKFYENLDNIYFHYAWYRIFLTWVNA